MSNLNSQLGFSPTRTRTRTTTFSDHPLKLLFDPEKYCDTREDL